MSDHVSRALLAHAHTLLQGVGGPASPGAALEALARAAGCAAAGLARCGPWAPAYSHPARDGGPWLRIPDLPALLRSSASAVALPGGAVAALTHAPDGSPWVVWAEPAAPVDWDPRGLSGFAVAAMATTRALAGDPEWAGQAERAARQARMEMAANLTRHLSHDFGNILTGIMGFTELAQAQPMPASTPLHSYLNEIYRAAQTGAQFTERLRLFSRRQTVSTRPCPLPLALAGLSSRLQALRDAGHQVSLDIPAGLPAVGVGVDSLQQVIGALLDNAREALPAPGAVSVSARAVTLDEAACRGLYGAARPGQYVEVTVADTGSGLSAEAQGRLFDEPFFSTKARKKGFGLAVAYGILSAHQGGLRLYAGTERGVVARVVLPAGTAAAPAAVPEAAAPPVSAPAAQRVMVVDDERDVLASVAAALEQSGYRVQAFQSGEKALEAYFAAGPDPFALVLTDVLMPELGGVELVRRLLKRDQSARVLFMSGFVSSDFLRHDFAGRQFELVNKPFRLDDLLSAVRAALSRPAPPRRPGPREPLLSAKKS